jgi:hypothetical protein
MGLIREPLDVDFTVDPQVLTIAEKRAISEYIRECKSKEVKKPPVLTANNKLIDSSPGKVLISFTNRKCPA